MITRQPNPQGKGLALTSAFLKEVSELAVSPAKTVIQIANKLFNSMFVLQRKYWIAGNRLNVIRCR